ncbi:hypothetical protein ES705_18699 [subsurface metagenome]
MSDKEGLTIPQAAKAMRLSQKTVRRQLKQGKLPFKLVPGKFGDEYRILELPPDKVRDEALNTSPALMSILSQLREDNKELQATNLQLAGQLGAAQERVRALENQVKLLTTPHKPWWRRLFWRKE